VHFHTAICRLQTGFPAENLHFIKKNAASGTGAIQIVAKGRSCAVIRKNGDFSSLPTASVIANPQGEAIHTRTLDCFILRIRNDGCDSLKCRALDGLFLRISLKNGIFDYSKMTSTQIFSDKHPERLLPPSDGIPNFLLNPSAAQ
jgi:hypothetical protein